MRPYDGGDRACRAPARRCERALRTRRSAGPWMNSPRALQPAMICFGVRAGLALRSARWRVSMHVPTRSRHVRDRVQHATGARCRRSPRACAIVHAAIHPADPVADRRVLDLQEVREVRRPHVEPRVRRAEQEPQLALRQVRVLEGRRVAVELLPVGLGQQRLELLEHRRARIRRQDLELRERRSEIGGVVDRRGDRVPVVLQEAEHVERRGDDAAACGSAR